MTAGVFISLAGLVFTLVLTMVGAVGFLVRATWQLAGMVKRVEGLEEKYQEREERNEAADRAVRDFGLVTEGYNSLKSRLEKHESHITELRITTGIMRHTQGEVG